MTNYKALCAELASYLQGRKDLEYGWPGEDPEQDLLDRARAALAQPEPVERPIWTEGVCGDGAAILKDGVMQPIESVIAALNAAELAQPEPEDDEIDEEAATVIPWLLEEAAQAADAGQPYAAGKLTLAAQLLATHHTTETQP